MPWILSKSNHGTSSKTARTFGKLLTLEILCFFAYGEPKTPHHYYFCAIGVFLYLTTRNVLEQVACGPTGAWVEMALLQSMISQVTCLYTISDVHTSWRHQTSSFVGSNLLALLAAHAMLDLSCLYEYRKLKVPAERFHTPTSTIVFFRRYL